jgi:hypothetical protein
MAKEKRRVTPRWWEEKTIKQTCTEKGGKKEEKLNGKRKENSHTKMVGRKNKRIKQTYAEKEEKKEEKMNG